MATSSGKNTNCVQEDGKINLTGVMCRVTGFNVMSFRTWLKSKLLFINYFLKLEIKFRNKKMKWINKWVQPFTTGDFCVKFWSLIRSSFVGIEPRTLWCETSALDRCATSSSSYGICVCPLFCMADDQLISLCNPVLRWRTMKFMFLPLDVSTTPPRWLHLLGGAELAPLG